MILLGESLLKQFLHHNLSITPYNLRQPKDEGYQWLISKEDSKELQVRGTPIEKEWFNSEKIGKVAMWLFYYIQGWKRRDG